MKTRWEREGARVALAIALAYVLALVGYPFPQGGKVSLQMVPILVLALLDGAGPGVVAGTLFGALDTTLDPHVVHPVQVILDYLMGFGVLGLAGLFAQAYRESRYRARWAEAGVLTGVLARYLASVVSGAVWFTHGHWGASAAINAGYLAPDLILAVMIVPVVASRMVRV